MNHDTSEGSVLPQKEEEVPQLNEGKESSENSMDDINLNLKNSNELIIEQCTKPQGCETSPSRSSCDEISLNESSSSDLQAGDDLEVPFCNWDSQIIKNQISFNSEYKSLENCLIGLDFTELSQKPKEEILQYIKETFQKFVTLVQETNIRHENELDRFKADQSVSPYQTQIEALEKDLAQAKADAFAWKNQVKNIKEKLTQENIAVRSELTSRLERLTKQCESSNREKEAMVMKFAKGEKEVLVVKKQKETVEKKVKELERDKEILQGKVKSLNQERTRICNTLDNKIQENGIALRNIDKLKEETNAKDIKIKWGQTKLKSEIDAHKETQAKLDRALSKICNHEEEIQSTREEAERIVKETKEGENSRANVLEKQLKETKALLILEKQKYDDVNSLYKQVKAEYETLRTSHLLLDTEATTLRIKTTKYEQEREESEKLFESLQTELKNVKQEAAELSQKLSHSSVYAEQLESEKVKSGFAEQEIKDLQMKLEEQSIEMSKCREKEAELLAFTQKLTDKDVTLRSKLAASQGKVSLLEVEHAEMKGQVQDLQAQVTKLTKELMQLKETKKFQEESLSSQLSQKTREASELQTKVSDLTNEIQVQQKKHANSLKDSNREVQKLRKKLDTLESGLTPRKRIPAGEVMIEGEIGNGELQSGWCHQESLSQESRASSDMSLNATDSYHINGSGCSETLKDASLTGQLAANDLPQHVLIDRIIKLQKDAIRRSEKVEFLEEHVSQLVSELKKKNKIIHHYVMKEDPGALVNAKSDVAKAEIIKHGGIMASVYGSTPKDGTMTLDLSLEINRKLQAVLEDTLLKNITLKENLNTLGDEVAKLALQNSNIMKHS